MASDRLASVRLLYLPNEHDVLGWQKGPRAVFERMASERQIEAYEAYSFEYEWKHVHAMDATKVLTRIREIAESFGPTIILWQHPKDFPVTREFVAGLKTLPSKPRLLYDERDPYSRERPLPAGARVLAATADLVSIVGFGEFEEQQRMNGARRIVYSPHAADLQQFGTPWEPTLEREWEVVMIANLHGTPRVPYGKRFFRDPRWRRSRLWWKWTPGNAGRLALARRLHEALGDRFALFGSGWDGLVPNHGPIPYHLQEETCRQAWLTANWDQFDTVPYYFSDRLPIAMVSGVAHACHAHPGYDRMFRNGEELLYAKTAQDIVDSMRWFMSLSPAERNGLGRRGRARAMRGLTYESVLPRLLEAAVDSGPTPW